MYSFIEIERLFQDCRSFQEIRQARQAFATIHQDGDLSNTKLFFVRKQQRLRLRDLEKSINKIKKNQHE
jgi:hypothetical protein